MTILNPKRVPGVYKKLDPKGLFVYTVFNSKAVANCYLPKFIGGDGGELVEKVLNWAQTNNIRITREKLREYLTENNLEISKELVSQIVKEVRKKPSKYDILNIQI